MNKLMKLLVFTAVIGGALIVVLKATNNYIVLDLSQAHEIERFAPALGDTVRPLSSFDFSKDVWKSVVVVALSDVADLPPSLKSARCVFTEDPNILKKMQENWKFIYAGGDMATVESKFYLYKNATLVFKCGIVLDAEGQGLQSSDFGWLAAKNNEVISAVMQFNNVKCPIIFL